MESSGEHRGHFDIKRGGLVPIVDIGRYAARRGRRHGHLDHRAPAGRRRSRDAAARATPRRSRRRYDLFAALRLEHQVQQLEAGATPDDHLDPKALNPLTRKYLKDAFRAVASVQKTLASELTWSPADAYPAARHPLARGRVLRGRPRDDRPRPRDGRDHLLGRAADRERAGARARHPPPARPSPPHARRGDDRDPRAAGDRPRRRARRCPRPSTSCSRRSRARSSWPTWPRWSGASSNAALRRSRPGADQPDRGHGAAGGASCCGAAAGGSRRRSASSRWRASWACRRTALTRPTAMRSPPRRSSWPWRPTWTPSSPRRSVPSSGRRAAGRRSGGGCGRNRV